MAHHRCTRCKQESYPRHKYQGGVYCDGCIREIRGGVAPSRGLSWFGLLWGRILDFAHSVSGSAETLKHIERAKERASLARFKVMQAGARSIPANPAGAVPQAR